MDHRRRWRWAPRAMLVAALLAGAGVVEAQQSDLGHKTLGALGLRAGMQPESGVYLATRSLDYAAASLVDRTGSYLPVGLDLLALSGGVGIGATFEVPALSTFVGGAIGVSAARVDVHTERPEASLDRDGLGDLFVSPLQLGWRLPRFEVVASYSFYAPTGGYAPGGNDGVGNGHWTHEVSLGGTAYFDEAKTWFLTALGSWDLNTHKRVVDVTRGETLQLQGGLGKKLGKRLRVGVASYALWQLTDDSGADLPMVLQGARDRIFGVGPEIEALIPAIQGQLVVRWERELGTRARPEGQVLMLSLTIALWQPREPKPSTRE